MSAFLVDTLVWTGVLLAFVLLVRRPVAQLFGAKAAYALWALPMVRLLLPPIVLPAWMAPAASETTVTTTVVDMTTEAPLASLDSFAAAPASVVEVPTVDWQGLLIALWLAGAAIFLVRRYALYFEMRRELLAGARPVGEAGRVRLVETPGADGPVAFGVIDKVVALPLGFMAGHDRAARDLALAHELAHHRGRDLVCNMLVQPLFALHWFNPLSLLGWRALRRDQEAACDARVIACEPRERRAAYATVIARFATEPKHAARLALAAPMACPVLGDRSIVQRLKSLKMGDISARRRWSGRLLIGASALALPLTGSISYAHTDSAAGLVAAPLAPLAPVAPAMPVAPHSASAPLAPPAPVAPPAPRAGRTSVQVVNTSEDGRVERHVEVRDGVQRVIEVRNGVATLNGRPMTAAERADYNRDMAAYRRDMEQYDRDMEQYRRDMKDHHEDLAELARDQAEHARDMEEMQRELALEGARVQREVGIAMAEAHSGNRVAARAIARAPRVVTGCRPGQREVSESVTVGGTTQIYVCNRIAFDEARRGIAQARSELGRTSEMSARDRAQALRSLDLAERSLRAN